MNNLQPPASDSHPSSRQSVESERVPAATACTAGRRYGIRDGLFQAVAQGGGEQYLSAFALLFHATPFHLSMLSAVPQLLGTWAQLLSVKVSHRFPNRKAQVLWGIVGQAISWIPILLLPLLWPEAGPWLLLCGVALYFACAHFTAPAWTSLITDLLDADERGTYFARRARAMTVVSFLALTLGGAVLSLFTRWHAVWIGFAVIFVVAGLCRAASALALSQVADLPPHDLGGRPTGFRQFLARGASRDFFRFLLFSGLMHAAVLVAGPFFVIYMLQNLHLPYWQYGAWMAIGLVGQLLSFSAWGRFSDRFGNKALLTITGFAVPVLPMLYLLSTAWPFLLAVNFFGGVVWAGLSLGLQNYVFDVVEAPDRAKAVAVTSVVNACGWAAGTLLGSWLIGAVPDVLRAGAWELRPVSNLPFIFFISGVLRLLVSGGLLHTFREPRLVEQRSHAYLLWELPLLKPLGQLALRRPNQ
jgi:MFS family permease